MKRNLLQRSELGGSRRPLWIALLGLGLLTGLSVADEGSGPGGMTPGGGGDSVGSLPSTAPPGTGSHTSSPSAEAGQNHSGILEAPSLVLRGTNEEIERLVLSITGAGHYEVRPGGGPGRSEVVFHGGHTLLLDRTALFDGNARMKIGMAPSFVGGVSSILLSGELVHSEAIGTQPIQMRLGQLAEPGGVAEGGITWRSVSPTRGRRDIRVIASGNIVRIDQN